MEPIITHSDVKRFESGYAKVAGCWIWAKAKNKKGYGKFGIGNKTYYAHRIAMVVDFRSLKEGQIVLHRCDNPSCVNPRHLFKGTQKDNMRDCKNKGRISRGEHRPTSKLKSHEVNIIRKLASERVPQNLLAQRFQVSRSTINQIIKNKLWKKTNPAVQ